VPAVGSEVVGKTGDPLRLSLALGSITRVIWGDRLGDTSSFVGELDLEVTLSALFRGCAGGSVEYIVVDVGSGGK